MKKTFYSFMAFAAMAVTFASCSSDIEKDNTHATKKVAMTFSATQETSGASSRTTLSADNKVLWQNTDAITVWDGTEKNPFNVTPDTEDGSLADITGNVTAGATSFSAVYPNSVGQNCTYNADAITGLVIPAEQTATAGSYDPAAAIMTAKATKTILAFKNVCSFLKITTAAAYTKVVVSVATGSIAGTFSVVPETGVATATNGTNTVTLKPAGSATSIATGTYYIAIAPGTVTDLNIKCYTDASNYVEKSKTGNITFNRAGNAFVGTTTTDNGWVAPEETLTTEYVDFGDGVCWARCNLGASSPEEFGNYYAWGETSSKTTYTWANYKWGTSATNLTKYTSSSDAELDYEDDAAYVDTWHIWRLPTEKEVKSLIFHTYYGEIANYNGTGVAGWIFYKKVEGKTEFSAYTTDDVHIFLPSTGYYTGDTHNTDYPICYWTSTWLGELKRPVALVVYNGIKITETTRHCWLQTDGLPIRAVKSGSKIDDLVVDPDPI